MYAESDKLSVAGIRCAECDTSNPSERKFCSECGASLWTTCNKCDSAVSVSEKFCGSCGLNLEEFHQIARTECLEKLAKVRELSKRQQFEEAISLSRVLCNRSFGIQDSEIKALKSKIEIWQVKLDEQRGNLSASVSKAEQAISEHRYADALNYFTSFSEEHHTDEIRSCIRAAENGLKEIDDLRRRVRTAAAEGRIVDLLPKLERLSTLTPNDAKIRKLAENVRDQLVGLARKRLDKGEYDGAFQAIQKVLPFVENDTSRRVAEDVETAYWLTLNLRFSTHADSSLADTASRLRKTAPNYPELEKVSAELSKRIKLGASKQPKSFIGWGATPIGVSEPFQSGSTADFLSWAEAFRSRENLDKNGGAYGCRFAIPIGLALQGLDRHSIGTDLSGAKKGSWLSKVKLSRKRGLQVAWGLCIGSTSIKVVRLSTESTKGEINIDGSWVFSYPDSLSSVTNDFERRDLMRNALLEAKQHCSFEGGPVVASFNSVRVLARFVSIPNADDKRTSKMIESEVAHQIPFPLNDVHSSHHLHDPETPESDRNLTIVAVRKNEISVVMEMIDSIEVPTNVVQSEAVALHNLLAFCRQQESLKSKLKLGDSDTAGLIHHGGDGTTVVLSHPNRMWYRYFPHGSQALDRAISSELNVTLEVASQIKKKPVRYAAVNSAFRAAARPLKEVCYEISRSIEAAVREHSSMSPQRMYVVGGGSQFHGFIRALRGGAEQLAVTGPNKDSISSRVLIDD